MQVGVSLGRFYTPASSYRHPLRWDLHRGDREARDASARALGLSPRSSSVVPPHCLPNTRISNSDFCNRVANGAGPLSRPLPRAAAGGEQRRREARGARPELARVSPAGGGGAAPEPAFLRSYRSRQGDVTPGSAPVPPRAK